MIIKIFNGDIRIATQNVKTYGKYDYQETIYFVDNKEWCAYHFPDRMYATQQFEEMLTKLDLALDK